MLDISVMQHNYRSRYLVRIDNEKSIVNNYKYEKSKVEKTFLVLKPSKILSIFIGTSCLCRMTEKSGACQSSDFDGNTILVGSDDIGYNEYVFVSGFEIIKFTTQDKIIHFISLMGNNMIPTAIALGEKNKYFISDHYKVFENIKIEKVTLLNSTNDSLDPFDYHLAKCGEGSFKTMECNQIHSFHPNEEAEEDDEEEDNGELREN